MRILITGGFGFIGGRIAMELSSSGHQITLVTRNKFQIKDWLPCAEIRVIDWGNLPSLEALCEKIDVVIHAAGMDYAACELNPAEALSFNGLVTARLIESACNSGVRRFIYISTAHVYSNPLLGEIDEGLIPNNPHPYATSHVMGERAVLDFAMEGRIQGIILRLSNAYGVPAHAGVNCWHLLINDLCRQAIKHKVLRLRSPRYLQRDFISMTDVCYCMKKFVEFDMIGKLAEIYNLGSGQSRSISEVASLIQSRCNKILGFKPKIYYMSNNLNKNKKILNFNINKIIKKGYKSENNNTEKEIDSLLNYCYKSND